MIEPIQGTGAEPQLNRAALGKEEFLQLLVTQLRNQDPLSPADPKDFAAQLAQFSTVEQLLNIGKQLESQQAMDELMIQTVHSSSAVQLLGRTVIVPGDAVDVPASGELEVQVLVGEPGGSGELILTDKAGVERARIPVSALGAGRQTIDLDNVVGTIPAGRYSYRVELHEPGGDAVAVTTLSVLRVDGIRFTPSGPILTSGPATILLGDVIEILE